MKSMHIYKNVQVYVCIYTYIFTHRRMYIYICREGAPLHLSGPRIHSQTRPDGLTDLLILGPGMGATQLGTFQHLQRVGFQV